MKLISSLFLLFILLLSACSEEEIRSCAVNVQVVFPEDYATQPFDDMKVTLTNKAGGTAYTSPCSSAGVAAFDVEPGDYAASVYYQTATGLVFNGRIESLSLMPDGVSSRTVELVLIRAKSSALVIKEIYYGGCKGRENEEYMNDQYITLYNNSNETLYLDGLCVAEVDFSIAMESPWMQRDPNMERIPAGYISWQFPGNGQDYPLVPGAETTIAVNAVDHTGGGYQHENSVNLSAVEWGFYDLALTNEIAPNVKPMKMLLRVGMSTNSIFSILGPTVMIFALPVPDVATYVADPANREMEPGFWGDPAEMFLMIPRKWVIDCIECVYSADELTMKRVPAELDSEATYIPGGNFQGKSLCRKKNVSIGGHTTYQDTNNSARDFEISTPSLKR